MELLSLTNDKDLVLARIGDYYLCLSEPNKRKYGLNWFKASEYCESLGEDYSLPSRDELNLLYKLKGDLSLVEVCLYGEVFNTLDFICTYRKHHSDVWSSSEYDSECIINQSYAWIHYFDCFGWTATSKEFTALWTIPIRRLLI